MTEMRSRQHRLCIGQRFLMLCFMTGPCSPFCSFELSSMRLFGPCSSPTEASVVLPFVVAAAGSSSRRAAKARFFNGLLASSRVKVEARRRLALLSCASG